MSDNFLKRYLKQNPETLKSYVQWGVSAAQLVVAPVSKLLRHLLEVQDIDPNTAAGVKIREAFQEALNAAVDIKHRKDYDDSFDFSRIGQGFNRLNKKLEITEDDFKKMTDLNYATDPPKPPDAGPKEDLEKVLDTVEGRAAYRQKLVDKYKPDPIDELAQLLDESEDEDKKDSMREGNILKEAFSDERGMEEALQKLVRIANSLKAKDPIDRAEYVNIVQKQQQQQEELGLDEAKKLMLRTVQLQQAKQQIVEEGSEVFKKDYFEGAQKNPTFRAHNPRIRRTKTGNVKAVKSSSKELNKTPKPQTSTLKKNLRKQYKKHMLKLPEAQALAQEMVARGLCANNQEDIKLQIDEIMKFDRSAFEALGRVVSRHPLITVATSKVDKEVETVQKFIAEGKIQPSEVDDLVGEGMDPEVAKAWKHKYGQKLPPLLVEEIKKIAKENKASGHFKGSFRRSPRR